MRIPDTTGGGGGGQGYVKDTGYHWWVRGVGEGQGTAPCHQAPCCIFKLVVVPTSRVGTFFRSTKITSIQPSSLLSHVPR